MPRPGPLVTIMLALAGSAAGQPPIGAHQADWLRHADAPTHPSLLGDEQRVLAAPEAPAGARPCRTVFGYLPYWENTSALDWTRLTHVACFSVEVNSNGTLGNKRGWPWWSVINTAKANGVKVILVATLFDGPAIRTLITTPAYKQAFFDNIRQELVAGDADGLNIDFESGTTWQSDINAFMGELNTYLKSHNADWELTFASPAVNWSNRFDLPGLAAACDGLFVMGYAFAGSWSSVTGANAPLLGGSINITNTLDVQYAGVPGEKLILGVPYYGHHWRTSGSSAGAAVTSFVSSTRFYNDVPNAAQYGRRWDAASQTPWYRWQSAGVWNQVWYDDAESLGHKYDAALARGAQGIGMWALGYDEGRSELWDAIESHVGLCGRRTDFDGDGDVDGQDFVRLIFCAVGDGNVYADGHVCRVCDFDGDHDVDLADVADAQVQWGQ